MKINLTKGWLVFSNTHYEKLKGILQSTVYWFFLLFLMITNSSSRAEVAPVITAAYSNAPGMAVIAYQHPGSDGVESFRLDQEGVGTRFTSAHLSDTFTVLGLQPDTSYQFQICAVYSDGSVVECSETSIRTRKPQETLPAQVAPEVRYVKSTENSVTVGWGNVGDYKKLLVRVEDERGNSDQRDVRPVGFEEFTFPNMRPGARYKLLVKGCGDPRYPSCGPWSKGDWVTTAGASRCKSGFVWREAYSGDVVCVTPESRDQAVADNAAALSRIAPCRAGFTPRKTVPGDNICVTPAARNLAVKEKELNPERSTFLECARLAVDRSRYPNPAPCKPGFVHRLAAANDHVCVPPEARQRVIQENAAHSENKGVNICIDGYVWRLATPSDLVCVKPEIRKQTATENATAASRVEP
ncbi:fibronectin type III domain-containing protein [Cellvibrio sp. ARAG 10.3]|uniref:fibronectin type III domain-containing protein n=1 Tax=Cellvibrio sp. ARAG 10.3 TaxID=3451358 RepID=UPI003F481B35